MKKLIFIPCLIAAACAVVPITGRKQFIAVPADQIISLEYYQAGKK
jgi:hypothetical protein